jgi:hypothetical protein
MFATVGATGAAAQPLPAAGGAGLADPSAVTAPSGGSVEMLPGSQASTPASSQEPCLAPGQPQVAGSASRTATTPPLAPSMRGALAGSTAQSTIGPVVPRPCAEAKPQRSTADLVAAAAKFRAAIVRPARHHATTAIKPGPKGKAPTSRPALHTPAPARPASQGSAAPNAVVSVKGTVTNAAVDPLAGIEVDVLDLSGYTMYTGSTDSEGKYSIVIAPGDYNLWFTDATGTYATGYYDAGSGFVYDWYDASTVTVSSVDVTADITLPPAVHIKGTVTNAAVLPLADIEVDLEVDASTYYSDTTDASGVYSIEVAPGDYDVWFADASETYASGYYSTGGFTYDTPSTVTVSSADRTIDITLPPAMHIQGTVTNAAVLPLAGIDVYVESVDWSYYTWTDASGKYSTAVAPGNYTLSFSDPDGQYATGYYSTGGFVYDWSAATAVAVSSGDVTGKDVTLPVALYITGTVIDEYDAPVPDIEVDVYAAGGDPYDYNYTDSDGYYSVEVAPGSYTLYFYDYSGTYANGYYGTGGTSGFVYLATQASTLVVSTADVTGKDVTLPPAIHIKGKVTRSGGVALPAIQVYALDLHGNIFGEADTDGAGMYSISVDVGDYNIWFYDASGHYGSGYYSTSGFTYFATAASKVTVSGADVTGKNVTLPVAVHIKGKVTNSGAAALPGIRVDASSPGYYNDAVTDGSGNYSVAVAPGTYTLTFRDASGTYAYGYYSTSGFTYDRTAASGVAVSSADVTGKNVTLPLTVYIQGNVTNAAADPLPEIEVEVVTLDGTYYDWANTDEDGAYSVAVAPGSYAIELYDPSGTYPRGFYNDSSSFTSDWDLASAVTVGSGDVTVDITLPVAAHITGKVTRSGGAALSDIYVQAGNGDYYNYTWTDGDGDYSLAVAPGSYTLSFYDNSETYGSGYYSDTGFTYDLSAASAVAVASSDVTGKDVTLPLALHIKGKVTKSGGGALSDIFVSANSAGSGSYAYTDTSGNYSVAVAPGSYTLSFQDNSGTYGSGYYSTGGFTYSAGSASAVAVSSVDVTGKDVILPLAVHIKGKVTKSGGTGLSGIGVLASSTGSGPSFYADTTSDGTFSVAVAPGSYTLWFYDSAGTYASGYYSTAGFTYFVSAASTVAVASADVTGKNVILPVAVHIKGTATRSGGLPVPGITVYADRSGISYSARTDANGNYSVAVSAGSYTLEFVDYNGTYATGYYSTGGFTYNAGAASTVTVSSADATGKNVVLPRAVRIKGTVTDTGANPLGAIEVDAANTAGGYSNWSATSGDGTYSVEVAPGSYTLWFRDHSGTYGNGYYSTGGFVYDLSEASAVPVSASDVTGIDVTMASGPGLMFPATTYHAIAPARILDTRPTGGGETNMGLSGKFVAGTVRTFAVANARYVGGGNAAAVPWNATAVTGNLTIVGESAAGLIALGPTMTPTGDVTTLNFIKGDVRANNVTVGLAPGGTLDAVFRSSTAGATVNVIFDVTGYFTPDTGGATYHPVTPGRVLDTRATGSGHVNIGLKGKFATKVVRTFSVAGVKGIGWASALVPSTATAVTGNLTITKATSAGYVSVGPTMASTPKTSTINVAKGVNIANGVTVALNAGKLQAVWVGAAGSSTDMVFDVTGYFTADLTGLRYHPIVPLRYLDSSTGTGLTGPFATNTSRVLVVAGVGTVPADAAGISGNLTLLNPSTGGFAFISPNAVGTPTSSTLNTSAHLTLANGFDVPFASGNVTLIWCGGIGSTTNMALDVTGYWK